MTVSPFLGPILARAGASPDALFGMFHDGEADAGNEWTPLSLAGFLHRARQFTTQFEQAGMRAGDVVLIILQHGIDAHAAFIGAMLAGGVPSFMPHPSARQEAATYWRQHRHAFAHIRPRAILVYDALQSAMQEAAQDVGSRILAASAVDALLPAAPGPLPPADAIALLQHSSGTTGLKKGVRLSHRAITDQLAAYARALAIDAVADPRIASWLPLYHDMGLVSSFLLPLWLGVPILSIDPFEWTRRPALLFEAIETHRATHAWVPNFALLHQVNSARRSSRVWDLGSLRALIGCSEPCKPAAYDAFAGRFAADGIAPSTLQTCYAMAETVFAVTQSQPGIPVRRLALDRDALLDHRVEASTPDAPATILLSNGPPLDGVCLRIAGAEGRARVIGEVLIAAPFLFSGYNNDADATARALQAGWLHSGDLGFLDDGELFVVGRLKDVIIVNGRNILAHDVEAALGAVAAVKPGRAVAFGQYDPARGSEQLVVVAERMRDDGTDDDAEAARAINHAVTEEVGIGCGDIRMVPQGWLVKTTSGKVSRADNAAKYAAAFAA